MSPADVKLREDHARPSSAASSQFGLRLGMLLARSPLGRLVNWVAGIRASVHTKLLGAFLIVALLFIGTAAVGLQTVRGVAEQSRLLDEVHERVDVSRQIEHALAMQMNYTAMALILRNETAIGLILRENNRFNNKLAQIEEAAPTAEREIIKQIRFAQDQLLVTVADIANLLRDKKVDEAMQLHLQNGQPLYDQIEMLVQQIVTIEGNEMAKLRENVGAAHRQAMVLIGVFAGAAIVLALGLGFVISWSLILPVREANAFLSQVAKGEFSASIRVPNRDEFGALAANMNQMSRDLRRLDEEQRQATQQLRSLNRQLELASQHKSQFLANMSHELRTPLNAILGYTELINDEIYGPVPESIREVLKRVDHSGRHLLDLINSVLDISKIEAGRLSLALDEYSLGDLVHESVAAVESLAAEKELAVSVDVSPELPLGRADASRVRQVLLNLLSNAIKFTENGGITLVTRMNDGAFEVRVTDTGPGIAVTDQEQIFDEFQQVDNSNTREKGGTGLGLAISRKIIRLHGGELDVESEIGKGSTFWFTLPVVVDTQQELT